MFANFWSIIQTIRTIFSFIKQVQVWVKESRKNEIDRQKTEREKALEDLKNAKTREEFMEAQKRIAGNMP